MTAMSPERAKLIERYAVSRWSSPGEWRIETVPDGYEHQGGVPGEVFDTFSEAKAWLVDQTRAWVNGFRDDAAEIHALTKGEVQPASEAELASSYTMR